MPGATFHYGNVSNTIPHTPVADVAAGDVVVVGASIVGICVRSIPANVLGALNTCGGVYTMVANGAIAKGTKVYWDNVAGKVTATAGALKYLGVTVSASAADNDAIDVEHQSAGSVT